MTYRPTCSQRALPPAFTPVPVQARKDGWSAQVQCAFLASLYATGSVSAAAKAVGRSRASAYKLRASPGAASFAKSWDRVLEGPSDGAMPHKRRRYKTDWRKLTHAELIWRSEQGLWRPIIYRGRMCAIAQKPDNSALLHLLRRLDGRHAAAKSCSTRAGRVSRANISKTPPSVFQNSPRRATSDRKEKPID